MLLPSRSKEKGGYDLNNRQYGEGGGGRSFYRGNPYHRQWVRRNSLCKTPDGGRGLEQVKMGQKCEILGGVFPWPGSIRFMSRTTKFENPTDPVTKRLGTDSAKWVASRSQVRKESRLSEARRHSWYEKAHEL